MAQTYDLILKGGTVVNHDGESVRDLAIAAGRARGNLSVDDRVSLFLMDYPNRARLKILGHARVEDARLHPDLAAQLANPGMKTRVERIVFIDVVSFDWNCPKYITPRFTAAELEEAVAPVDGTTIIETTIASAILMIGMVGLALDYTLPATLRLSGLFPFQGATLVAILATAVFVGGLLMAAAAIAFASLFYLRLSPAIAAGMLAFMALSSLLLVVLEMFVTVPVAWLSPTWAMTPGVMKGKSALLTKTLICKPP